MPAKPVFSIVTCTWNSAATLADTLASVRSQTWPGVEHIFVDGGSTDGTLELLDAYPGNKRILLDVGGGISRAMNQGIAAASGDYVAHLHSDDYYLGNDVLASVADCFAAAGAEWVFGAIRVLKDGAFLPAYPMHPFTYKAFVAGKASVPHPAVFIRRSAFERVGVFDETLRYAMDIDLWLRLGAVAQPAMLERSLTAFRDHAGSISSANKLRARREEFAVRRRYATRAPLSFAIFCLRYLKRRRQLQREKPR